MIDHCVSALSISQQEKMYRIYVTDCLKYLTENTMHLVGTNGVVDYGIKMTVTDVKDGSSLKYNKIILHNNLRHL